MYIFADDAAQINGANSHSVPSPYKLHPKDVLVLKPDTVHFQPRSTVNITLVFGSTQHPEVPWGGTSPLAICPASLGPVIHKTLDIAFFSLGVDKERHTEAYRFA